MSFLKSKRIFSVLLIVLVAVATGFSVGKIYVDNIEVPTTVSANEEDVREKDTDVKKWVDRASAGASATSFTAVELYNIAEYKLYHANKYSKIMTGVVNAPMGIKQQMRSEKFYNNGKFVYNKLSPSTSSLSPSICSQVLYDSNIQKIKINPKGDFDKNSEIIKGIFDKNKYQNYTMEQYKTTFNSVPTKTLSYIVSSITCAQNKLSPVTKNSDGTYTFEISMDGNYLALAGLYYAYEIKFSSGMADYPKWVSLNMTVVIDENFNFKTINYNEVYKMNVSGIGMMQVTDVFVDNFDFVNVPDLTEYLEVL